MFVIKCKICNKSFKTYRIKAIFCSRQCSGKSKIGKTNWRKGKKFPEMSMEKHPYWKGGKHIISGYIYIYQPSHPFSSKQGYIAQHRLIMEKHLGRFLNSKESVHHINHIKHDNRIENLELMIKSNHQKLHGIELYPKGSMFGRNS